MNPHGELCNCEVCLGATIRELDREVNALRAERAKSDKLIEDLQALVSEAQQVGIKVTAERDRLALDAAYLLTFMPPWVYDVPEGLDPTMYGTGSRDSDLDVHKRVLSIAQFLAALREASGEKTECES